MIILNLHIALSSIVILTILILPKQEHGISFHLLCYLQFLSSGSYSFQSTGLLSPYADLFLGIFFDTMVNGTVSLISLSDISLLVYRNSTYLCVLILYPALMSSSSFLLSSLGFSMYSIMSSANSDNFTSYFPVWIPFIFLL